MTRTTGTSEPGPPAMPAEAVPGERIVELGRSSLGVPIRVHILGSSGPTVFVFGGIHGSEPTSAFVARRLLEHLRSAPQAYRGMRIAVLPEANPDGLAARTRGNANRVDLNRNFPAKNWKAVPARRQSYGGTAPASEPETRALLHAVELLDPVLIVSVHSISGPRECNNFDGPAGAAAELMSRHNGYPATPTIGYPTPGSFGSWAGIERGIPTITLELPRRQGGARSWEQNREALLELLRFVSGESPADAE